MPRSCTICSHPERPAIDAALQAGERIAAVARRFAVSVDALARHARQTPPPVPGAPQLEASSLVREAQRLHTVAGQLHTEALASHTLIATTLVLRSVTALVVELSAVAPKRGPQEPGGPR